MLVHADHESYLGLMTDLLAKRPAFINVGPGRSASTWFYKTLSNHTGVGFSKIKETEYFNTDYDQGPTHYERFFRSCDAPVIGEVSNLYYASGECLDRIASDLPDVKIIFNVRNPYRLLASMYGFSKRRGLDLSPQAFLEAPLGLVMGSGYLRRKRQGSLGLSDSISVLESVALRQHILNLESRFAPERIYFLLFDQVAESPSDVIKDVTRFLGIADLQLPEATEGRNAAIVPRMRLIGRLATLTAASLRKIGAYDLLTALHNSSFIKRYLFKSAGSEIDIDFRALASTRELTSDLHYLENRFEISLNR